MSSPQSATKLGREIGIGCFGGGLGRDERRVVGERGVARDAIGELDAPLDVQAVVVPAHRIEDLVPAHAPVAGDHVGLAVAADMARVEARR